MAEPLRVLQFITPSGFYGAERWVLALANNLDRQSVICDLAVTREGGSQDLTLAELYPCDPDQQVHHLDMHGRFDIRVLNGLCRIIRDRRIDVIHTHGYKSDILGLLAARRTGIACVSTPHGFSGKVGWKLGTFIKVGTHMLRYFDRVVPLSDELMQDIERFGVPSRKIRFIRNGVDLTEIDEVASQSSRSISQKNERATIGFVGQMIPRKGIRDLLDVFESLHREDPTYQLQLLGDGRQRAELESYTRTLNSRDSIQFLGFRSDRLELLARFDVFVMTSSLEGIPRCMMEAMAVGVPVVAYDIPGVDQLVEHGRTGLLAPHGDKTALMACCQELLDNPARARELAASARKLIEERYSAARMAREYEELFLNLAGQSTAENTRSVG